MTKNILFFLLFASTLPAMEKNFESFSENENTIFGSNNEHYNNKPTWVELQFIFENPAVVKEKKVRGKRLAKEQEKPIIPANYMNDFAIEPKNTINTGNLGKMKLNYILNDDQN